MLAKPTCHLSDNLMVCPSIVFRQDVFRLAQWWVRRLAPTHQVVGQFAEQSCVSVTAPPSISWTPQVVSTPNSAK